MGSFDPRTTKRIGNTNPQTSVSSSLPRSQTSQTSIRRTTMKRFFTPEAEILNARLAMIGFVAGVGAYLTTGQLIPGVW